MSIKKPFISFVLNFPSHINSPYNVDSSILYYLGEYHSKYMTIIYCHVLNLKCHRSIREETTIYYSLYKQKTPVRSLLLIQGYAFPAVSRRTDHDRNPKNSNPRDAPDGEHLQAHCDYPIYTQGNGEVLLPTCRKEGAVRPSPTTRKHLMQTMWEGNRPGGKTQEADLL